MKRIALLCILVIACHLQCIHDNIAKTAPKHYFNDLEEHRLLQVMPVGKMRVHLDLDYIQIPSVKPMFTKIMEIVSNFYRQLLTVPQRTSLLYPNNTEKDYVCNSQRIPQKYIDNGFNPGIEADVGIIVGTKLDSVSRYIASALACAQLQRTKRPIWGVMNWNLNTIQSLTNGEITPIYFQRFIYVGAHQFAHILGFSSNLFPQFQGSALTVSNITNPFATNPLIKRLAEQHFNCSNTSGLGFQNRYKETSHWEKQHVGNELMSAVSDYYPYISSFTIELFNITGWYPQVNSSFAEPTIWGKGKGCPFIQRSCNFQQYCTQKQANIKQTDCNWEGTGMGLCQQDGLTQGCHSNLLSPNAVCLDPDYLQKRPTNLTTFEQPGKYSKCFKSNLRLKGEKSNKMNNRCYQALCLKDGKYIMLRINNRNYICYYPGYQLKSPQGLQGTLVCPSNFDRICKSKVQCPFGCGSNGICINGKCLCRDKSEMTVSCPPDDARRLLMESQPIAQKIMKVKDSMKCPIGRIFDPITKSCQSCSQLLLCEQCDNSGCLICDDGSQPVHGKCF